MLTKIKGPNRADITGGWRKLHNEKIRNLANTIKDLNKGDDGMVEAHSGHGKDEKCTQNISEET